MPSQSKSSFSTLADAVQDMVAHGSRSCLHAGLDGYAHAPTGKRIQLARNPGALPGTFDGVLSDGSHATSVPAGDICFPNPADKRTNPSFLQHIDWTKSVVTQPVKVENDGTEHRTETVEIVEAKSCAGLCALPV